MTLNPNTFQTLFGPWALITGASNGIGAAIAEEAGAAGLNLILTARHETHLKAVAEKIENDHGVETSVITADLSTRSGIETVMQSITKTEIGLFAACAGFGSVGAFADCDISDELNMVDVNCTALAGLTHPIAQLMRDRGRGGIILMSSIVAFQGVPNSANYAATKAYVQTLAEGLSRELSASGVRVLASAPGPVHTGFASRAGMRMAGAATAQSVAQATLNALGRTTTVRPGLRSKLLGYGLGALPRSVRSRILGTIMKGMMTAKNAS